MDGIGIRKIISGGQTGVDQAAVDAAMKRGVSYGGWCPQGRINENGKIDVKYVRFIEVDGEFSSDKENYDTRTIRNIQDSDGTLIIVPAWPLPAQIKDGTLLTIAAVETNKKPHLVIKLSEDRSVNIREIAYWAKENNIKILNVAGPRESNSPGIYELSEKLIEDVIPYIDGRNLEAKL